MTSLDEWRWVAMASLSLPDEKLLNVLALVERVADLQQAREMLDQIRPRLTQLRPPRRRTAQRLLFCPVEDLFDPPERYRSQVGRLSRQIIRPCWQIISHGIAPGLLEVIGEELREVDIRARSASIEIGTRLWRAAAMALRSYLADPTRASPAPLSRIELEGDIGTQLRAIAEVLEIATEIETAKANLPDRPVELLSEADLELVAGIIMRLGAVSPEQVQTFLLVILARMVRPGEVLKLLTEIQLPFGTSERTGMVKQIGTRMLANLVSEAQDLKDTRGCLVDPIGAARTAERLVDGFTSLEKSLGRINDRGVAEKVRAARAEIGSFVLESVVVKTDQALADALANGPIGLEPEEIEVERAETAERCALSLRRCARIADAVGVKKEVDRKLDSIRSRIERIGLTQDPDPESRERRLFQSVRLIELIAGPDEAEKLLAAGFGQLGSAR